MMDFKWYVQGRLYKITIDRFTRANVMSGNLL